MQELENGCLGIARKTRPIQNSLVLVERDFVNAIANFINSSNFSDYKAGLSYGETVPISDGGKLFCIFYCMLGVPLTLLIFACLVQRLMVLVTRRPVRYVHTRWGYAAGRVAVLHALLLGALMITFFFIIPAAIYTAMEGDWSFLESLYFCFISLSTIGLGDYIPGKTKSQAVRQAYEFGTSCYLILGLIGMLLGRARCTSPLGGKEPGGAVLYTVLCQLRARQALRSEDRQSPVQDWSEILPLG
ncbi:UNVERIFIED_CONTAM: hypothetical protein FKN15_007260 [Acipenser sinensis]